MHDGGMQESSSPSSHERLARCLDVTWLEREGDVARLEQVVAAAVTPLPSMPHLRAAAVCVLPGDVPEARRRLRGSGVRVATVVAFPTGLAALEDKLREVARALLSGAEELDVVVDRRPLQRGRASAVRKEVAALRDAAGARVLKVILETEALEGPHAVRDAALAALDGGADFVKTSTGRGPPGPPSPATVEAIADAVSARGGGGIKLSGGIREVSVALSLVDRVASMLGDGFVEPRRFRIGASTLVESLRREGERASGPR